MLILESYVFIYLVAALGVACLLGLCWCASGISRSVSAILWRCRMWAAALVVLLVLYLVVALTAFIFGGPWKREHQWRNLAALASESPWQRKVIHGQDWSWVAEQLAPHLRDSNTLVAISISGGGSRSAYFAAATLEQLSKLQMPGLHGPGSSLVNHIDVMTSVSGGSVAAAYFVAHVPPRKLATKAALAHFFADFKSAMARNFEADVARQVINPLNALAYLSGSRTVADGLADAFDKELFAGKGLTYGQLLRRERSDGAPLLIIAATETPSMRLFSFTKEEYWKEPFVPTQRPDPETGFSMESRSTEDYRAGPTLDSFGEFWGNLDSFRVADAVAASAAFPGFGTIRLQEPGAGMPLADTTALGDGGLADNSGLVSLYTNVLDNRSLFLKASGKLKRIVVIVINADTATGGLQGAVGEILGNYALGQDYLQQFVLPGILDRISKQDLADILSGPAWRGFRLPEPYSLDYGGCTDGTREVDTKFRLSVADQRNLDAAAHDCVDDQIRAILSSRLNGTEELARVYAGILGPADVAAWRLLFRLGQDERGWHDRYGQYPSMAQIRAGTLRAKDGRQAYNADIRRDLNDDEREELSRSRDFTFESSVAQGGITLYATPRVYAKPGRVSLALHISNDLLELQGIWYCMKLSDRFYGGDFRGRRARTTDPTFVPYGFDTYQMCI